MGIWKGCGDGIERLLNKSKVFFEVKAAAFMLGGLAISRPTRDKLRVKYTHYVCHAGICISSKSSQVMILMA